MTAQAMFQPYIMLNKLPSECIEDFYARRYTEFSFQWRLKGARNGRRQVVFEQAQACQLATYWRDIRNGDMVLDDSERDDRVTGERLEWEAKVRLAEQERAQNGY